MSDHWLLFIPEDPHAQPARDAADRALALLRTLAPRADKITSEYFDAVQFFDCGGNFESVHCPHCGTDAEPWWGAAMDAAGRNSFADLLVTAPCCGARVSLNDLVYEGPMGFARYCIGAMNADIGEVSPANLAALSTTLALPLRLVRQRV